MSKPTITIGSLFSGIGGLDLGIERGLRSCGVQAETVWQVEQNEYGRRVLARHWPHAERYEDVRDITAGSVAPVDTVIGGFPCQDISVAGNGAGLAGERSGLFYEMARIVRELRPQLWIMENVSALSFRGLDAVLGEVAALGYDARWGMLSAREVGAPHKRERWFCVAWLADTNGHRDEDRMRLSEVRWQGVSDAHRGCGRSPSTAPSMAHPQCRAGQQFGHDTGVGGARKPDPRVRSHPCPGAAQSRMGRDADGVSAGLDRCATERGRGDRSPHRWPAPPGLQAPYEPPRTRPRQPHDRERLKALGNAVVPQCGEVIGRWVATELLEPVFTRHHNVTDVTGRA